MADVPGEGSFATLLRRERLAARLSQEALAERASLSLETIGALERGVRRAPYRTTVSLLADGLELATAGRERLFAVAAAGRGPRMKSRLQEYALPIAPTSFVDRAEEQRQLASLLERESLVSICGPGGVGKTRLALRVAAKAHPGGVRFVEFASLRDPALVVNRIAAATGVPNVAGNGLPLLLEALRHSDVLLLLDNCEHLLDAAALAVEALVRGCPKLRILATSREPLLVDGETIFRLEPFADAAPAIDLFDERARAAAGRPITLERELVASIARRLDGMPLAIELAAALARTHAATDIERALAETAFLSTAIRRTAVEHQRTMEATLAWSYGLLSEIERATLRALAYPEAGTAKAAAVHLCGDGSAARVARLVDASLVHLDPLSGRVTLHQMTRQYVVSITSPDERAAFARAYGVWLADSLARAFVAGWEQASYLVYEPLAPELDNLRQAMQSALDSGDGGLARDLAGAPDYWTAVGRTPEGYDWLRLLEKRFALDGSDPRDATAIFGLALCAAQSGFKDALTLSDRAATVARRHHSTVIGARCSIVRGNALIARGDLRTAADELGEAYALFETAADRTGMARALSFRALALVELGQSAEAADAIFRVVRLHADSSGPVAPTEELVVEMLLGDVARLEGDLATALEHAREAAALLGDRHRTWIHVRALHQYVDVLVAADEDAQAFAIALPELDRLFERGFFADVALLTERLAIVVARQGDARGAALLAGFTEAELERFGRRRTSFDRRVRETLLGALEIAYSREQIDELERRGAQYESAVAMELLKAASVPLQSPRRSAPS